MKLEKLNFVFVAGIALALGACASAKPPVQEEVRTQAPPPMQPPPVVNDVVRDPVPQVVNTGPAPGTVEEFRVRVGERIYFDTDQYNVDSFDIETLQRQAAWLKKYPNVSILVAGNCDERGTREYNLALGARRANAVKEFLVAQGVPSDRIETISYGKERPLDGRSNEEAWQINRNALTQIVSGTIG